jgi:hypothetical protein
MSFESELQQAIFTRLSTYTGMPTVYDDVPQSAASWPYIVLGEDTHVPWDTDDSTGAESTITIHIWSRQRGKKETKDIQGLIYTALNRYEMSVDGHHLVTLEFDYSDVLLDPDGLSRHGVSRYRTLVEAEESTTA